MLALLVKSACVDIPLRLVLVGAWLLAWKILQIEMTVASVGVVVESLQDPASLLALRTLPINVIVGVGEA
jgi:hypothetical protein